MNRRTALKQVALLVGGAVLLPGCRFAPERAAVALNNLQIDADHQELLALVVETFIPSGQTPGARELEIFEFVLVMVDDCMSRTDQNHFLTGLRHFEPFVRQTYGGSFRRAAPSLRERILIDIMAEGEPPGPELGAIQSFLSRVKRYAIQGFLSSEYVLTERLPYVHIPGPYQPCVSVDKIQVT